MPQENEKEVLTRKDAAEFLQIPVQTIDYLVRTGQIPFSRIGKRLVRFYRPRLVQHMKETEGIECRQQKRK